MRIRLKAYRLNRFTLFWSVDTFIFVVIRKIYNDICLNALQSSWFYIVVCQFRIITRIIDYSIFFKGHHWFRVNRPHKKPASIPIIGKLRNNNFSYLVFSYYFLSQ